VSFQDLRSFLSLLRSRQLLIEVDEPVSTHLEAADILARNDGRPVFFSNVEGHPGFRIVGGIGSSREYFALALGIPSNRLLFAMKDALEHPKPPEILQDAPWMEEEGESLEALPFLRHWPGDGGAYATASIMFLRTPDGENASFHRLLRLDGKRMVARLVEGRGAHKAWLSTDQDLPVAIAIGMPPHILLAASMSPPGGLFEIHLANALSPTPLTPAPITVNTLQTFFIKFTKPSI
jgi:2,5-furandicarboxylate decarboxylase 1